MAFLGAHAPDPQLCSPHLLRPLLTLPLWHSRYLQACALATLCPEAAIPASLTWLFCLLHTSLDALAIYFLVYCLPKEGARALTRSEQRVQHSVRNKSPQVNNPHIQAGPCSGWDLCAGSGGAYNSEIWGTGQGAKQLSVHSKVSPAPATKLILILPIPTPQETGGSLSQSIFPPTLTCGASHKTGSSLPVTLQQDLFIQVVQVLTNVSRKRGERQERGENDEGNKNCRQRRCRQSEHQSRGKRDPCNLGIHFLV